MTREDVRILERAKRYVVNFCIKSGKQKYAEIDDLLCTIGPDCLEWIIFEIID